MTIAIKILERLGSNREISESGFAKRLKCPAMGVEHEMTLDQKGGRRLRWTPYRDLAKECDVAFWNLTVPTADAIAASRKPHDWFNRDYVHNNDRGKQLIGRVLQRYFQQAAR